VQNHWFAFGCYVVALALAATALVCGIQLVRRWGPRWQGWALALGSLVLTPHVALAAALVASLWLTG
jgi:hypothetical protein